MKFEELRSLLSIAHPTLDEAYFVASFISGLDEQVNPLSRCSIPYPWRKPLNKLTCMRWHWTLSPNDIDCGLKEVRRRT